MDRPWQVRIDKPIAELVAGLPGQAAAVFLAVVSHADGEGLCFPAYPRLAELTGLTERHLRRVIKTLVGAGALTRERQAGKVTHYRLGEDTSVPRPVEGGTSVSGDPGHQCPLTRDISVPLRNNSKEATPKKRRSRRASSGYSDDFEAFWAGVSPHKKMAKKKAAESYVNAVEELAERTGKDWVDDPHGFLREKATAYYASPLGKIQFANMPSVWLNQGHYDDAPEAWERKDNSNGEDKGAPVFCVATNR